jgi:tetratricopeptide (TPR) repeat protein
MTFGGPMPETAKVLQFPAPSSARLRPEQALEMASDYLGRVADEGPDQRREALLGVPDVLLSVCMLLREQAEGNPAMACKESVALYRCISASEDQLGSFDEKDYFRGETALIAGMTSRGLGKRAEAELWLDRAEAGFRHTVNPSPLLANVTYQRLALRCEMSRYEEVIELAPMLAKSFGKLGMLKEQAKCVFLEAVALKQSGSLPAAMSAFQSLHSEDAVQRDPGLVGFALSNLADMYSANGREDLAAASYSEALPLLKRANRPIALAHLKSVIAESFRRQGRLAASIEAYQAAVADYETLEMATWTANMRVCLAQVLLDAGKPREAEWQVLAALPTIDEEKMVPEGFAAVAFLRESVRQRKTDPTALAELRQYLQAKN